MINKKKTNDKTFKYNNLKKITQFVKNKFIKKKIGDNGNMLDVNDEKNNLNDTEEQLIPDKNESEAQISDEMSDKDKIDDNKLESEIKETKTELLHKCNELNDKFLRLYSEFDNYRKRTLREKLELTQTNTAEVIASFLPVLDDFERALEAMTNDTENNNPYKEGVNLIYSKLLSILTQKGLEAMNCKGTKFNPDFHEAIANIPAETEDMKNKIADVIAKGYLIKDKVVRYAKVVVAN